MPTKAKKRYTGRVQYRAVQSEVESLLAAGYPASHIYQKFFEAGKLSLSYSSFCDYVRGRGERLHHYPDGYWPTVSDLVEEPGAVDWPADPLKRILH